MCCRSFVRPGSHALEILPSTVASCLPLDMVVGIGRLPSSFADAALRSLGRVEKHMRSAPIGRLVSVMSEQRLERERGNSNNRRRSGFFVNQLSEMLKSSLQERRSAEARERAERAKEEYRPKEAAACAERDKSFKMARQKKRSTIFTAARAGRWEQVKKGISEDNVDADGTELLTGLEKIIPKSKEPKETLLHLAAKAGVIDIFKWLVDHGGSCWYT